MLTISDMIEQEELNFEVRAAAEFESDVQRVMAFAPSRADAILWLYDAYLDNTWKDVGVRYYISLDDALEQMGLGWADRQIYIKEVLDFYPDFENAYDEYCFVIL